MAANHWSECRRPFRFVSELQAALRDQKRMELHDSHSNTNHHNHSHQGHNRRDPSPVPPLSAKKDL